MKQANYTTIVRTYRKMKKASPHAGLPVFQIKYDAFFRSFDQVFEETPQDTDEWQQLSAVKADYKKMLKENLADRDTETFRYQSYYWLSLSHDMDKEFCSSDFLEALAADAEQQSFYYYHLLQNIHQTSGCFLPSVEVSYLINIFLGWQFNPGIKYSMEEECIEIAKGLLDLISDDEQGRKAQLLALLHLRTGNPAFKQQAADLITHWDKTHLTQEQSFFLQYYKI